MQLHDSTVPPPQEEWRAVVGYEGWYDVSSLGRVRRIKAVPGARMGHIRKPWLKRSGYLAVDLNRRGRRRRFTIHRLVAAAFLGPCPTGHEANHKDHNRTNNQPGNLEWVSHGTNMRHRCSPAAPLLRGEEHGRAKLTEVAVRAIRSARGRVFQEDLARIYGVAPRTISHIQCGQTWKHVT